jgi:CheY-like chemotaxis protein
MSDKHTILLVDDDFIFLEMLKESLVDEDKYNIVGFQSGEECLTTYI